MTRGNHLRKPLVQDGQITGTDRFRRAPVITGFVYVYINIRDHLRIQQLTKRFCFVCKMGYIFAVSSTLYLFQNYYRP
jgi:hypothetical protein